MADGAAKNDGKANDDKAASGGGKGALGDLVKAESMIQLAIALPAGCVIGWLVGSWLDRHFHQGWIFDCGDSAGSAGRVCADLQDGIAIFEERSLVMGEFVRTTGGWL
jgi:hypothetical protein